MKQKTTFERISPLPIEKMTRQEVAQQAGCGERSVSQYCFVTGRKCFDKRRTQRDISDAEIARLYEKGYALGEITNISNLSKSQIHRIVERNNVKIRPMGRTSNLCDKEDIIGAYKNGASYEKIGKEFHIGQVIIQRILAQNGMKPRSTIPPKLPVDDNLIVSLFQSGMHVITIAKKLNCCSTTISNRLKDHGIEIGYVRGETSPAWKGGKTPAIVLARNGNKMVKWRKAVFERDHYTCQHCGDSRGHNLNAHHIIPFSKDETLRYELDNGITLCMVCHNKIHRKKL
jgi:hypothetical protein